MRQFSLGRLLSAILAVFVVLTSRTVPARAVDPVTVLLISGFVNSDTSAAGAYPFDVPRPAGAPPNVSAMVQFRAGSPNLNVGSIATLTGMEQPPSSNAQINSTAPIISYDSVGNTTTIKIYSGSSFVQSIIPIDLEMLPNLDAQVASKTLTKGQAFSGTINGKSYNGNFTSYADGSGSLVPAYQFLDANGNTILFAKAPSSGLNVTFPSAQRFLWKNLPIGADANVKAANSTDNKATASTYSAWNMVASYTLPSTTDPGTYFGSGTFSQTKNGTTLSGSFYPFSIATFSTEGSLDAYWSTH